MPVEVYLFPLLRPQEAHPLAETSERYAGASLDDQTQPMNSIECCRNLGQTTWPALAAGVLPAALTTQITPWITTQFKTQAPLLTKRIKRHRQQRKHQRPSQPTAARHTNPPAVAHRNPPLPARPKRPHISIFIRNLLTAAHVLWKRRCVLHKPP